MLMSVQSWLFLYFEIDGGVALVVSRVVGGIDVAVFVLLLSLYC